MSLYKEKMIEAVIKLNPTAKFSWLEQFNTTELHMYYRRLLIIQRINPFPSAPPLCGADVHPPSAYQTIMP